MSVLTKVFVILVTVFSVLLVGVVVTFVANQENWKQKYDDKHAQLLLAEAEARTRQGQLEGLQDQRAGEDAHREALINTLRSQVALNSSQAAQAQAKLIAVRQEKLTLESQNGKLIDQNLIATGLSQSQREELKQLRADVDTTRDRLIRANDLVADKDIRIEVGTRENDHLKESVIVLSKENEQYIAQLQKFGIKVGEDLAPEEPFAPAFRIDGAVTEVQEVSDDMYVQINVGSNDGVESNMKLLVHDQGEYKGTLVVRFVDENSSSGKIKLVEEGQKIDVGDQIVAGARF